MLRTWVAVVAVLLVAAGCGSVATSASSSPSPSPQPSPSPSPSSTSLAFPLAPAGNVATNASGTITVTPGQGSTMLELKIAGLEAASSHVSHIHVGSCQQRGSIALALNQVVADGSGNADAMSTVSASYPPSGVTWYVVVHAGPDMQGSNAQYLLCGNLFT
jgi:hypothetical protein